jgi:Fe-S cluster assembly iron-binding protein IscA
LAEKSESVLTLDAGAGQAIRQFLEENHIGIPLRLDLNFTGCCDASLCLRPDQPAQDDMVLERDGLTFLIHPEVYKLAGEITIFYLDESCRKGFVIKSSKPLSEWEGFGITDIKI